MESTKNSPRPSCVLPASTLTLAKDIRLEVYGLGLKLQDKFHARRKAAVEKERWRINLGRPEHLWMRPAWCPLHFGARMNGGSVELYWYRTHYRPPQPGKHGKGAPIRDYLPIGAKGGYPRTRLLRYAQPFEANIVLETEAAAADLRVILRDVRALGDAVRRIQKAWPHYAVEAADTPSALQPACGAATQVDDGKEDQRARPMSYDTYLEPYEGVTKSPRQLFT